MPMIVRLLCAALAALLAAAPAAAAWMEAGSTHFLVYGDLAPDRIEAFATRLEKFDQAMRVVFKLGNERPALPNRVTIYVLRSAGAVQSLCSGGRRGACQNIAGFYVQRASGANAFMPARAGDGGAYDLNADIVMFHEYAHHLLLTASSASMPLWLNEGIAEFASSASIDKDGAVQLGRLALHRAYSLVVAQQMPVAQLLTADRRKLSEADALQVYSRGWLLTHYMVFTPARAGQLARYLELTSKGTSSLDAGRSAFGDLRALDRELDRYIGSRSWKDFRIPPDALHVGDIAVRPLRDGEAELMPFRIRSVVGVSRDTAEPLAAAARARAARFRDDPWVQGVLAEMEYDAGHDDAAEAAADLALARDPRSLEALIYKGRVRLRRAEADKAGPASRWAEARGWLVRANHLEPDAPGPLMLYYDSFGLAGEPPGKNAKLGLERAAELAPQDAGVRARLALLYLRDGRLADARAALAILAYAPHARTDNPFVKLIAMIDAGSDAGTVAAAARIDAAGIGGGD